MLINDIMWEKNNFGIMGGATSVSALPQSEESLQDWESVVLFNFKNIETGTIATIVHVQTFHNIKLTVNGYAY